MAYNVELEFSAKTDTGRVRAHNEDSIAISPEFGLAILADGMGGYNAGEVASGIASSVLKQTLEARLKTHNIDTRFNRGKRIQHLMADSIAQANKAIIEAARSETKYSGMGTTLVAAFFYRDKVTIAHVGDSRAYRIRSNEMVQLTKDHSLLQEQIDAGFIREEDAQFSQNRNLITRAMGVDYDVTPDIEEHSVRDGDVYMLCSDGLSDLVARNEINEIFNNLESVTLQATCNGLVFKANQNGGRDNISVILIKTALAKKPLIRGSDSIFGWLK